MTADDSRRATDGARGSDLADEALADRALGAVLDELIDAIHETKQAVWLVLDAGQHRTLEGLRQFLVDQATQVGEAELRIDGRSPLLLAPGAHPYENLVAKAHGDQTAMLERLLADLEKVAADVRRQAGLIAGRDEARLLTGLADGLEARLAALRP